MTNIAEEDALCLIARAAGSDACPVHEIGPVANHLTGPVAAWRPSYHPNPKPNLGSTRSTVDRLIADASGRTNIACCCTLPASPRLFVLPGVSEGAIVRAPGNDEQTQMAIDAAMESADYATAVPVLEPRLDALRSLADRARANNGGWLTDNLREAVELITRTLAGSGRWAVIPGYEEGYNFPTNWRHGAPGIRASQFMADPDAARPIIAWLLGPSEADITAQRRVEVQPSHDSQRPEPPRGPDAPAPVLAFVQPEGDHHGNNAAQVRRMHLHRRQRV